jgi:hypothetical protein
VKRVLVDSGGWSRGRGRPPRPTRRNRGFSPRPQAWPSPASASHRSLSCAFVLVDVLSDELQVPIRKCPVPWCRRLKRISTS